MKSWKKLFLIILIVETPLLSACSSRRGSRDLEDLQVIQALGLDRGTAGVLVSLATAQSGGEAAGDSASASSISAAMERLQAQAGETELFWGQVRELIVGEEQARHDLEPLLSLVCRSSELRLDTPLYLLREAEAKDLLLQEKGAALLEGLSHRQEQRFGSVRFTAGRLLRQLERSGCGLACLLRLEETGDRAEKRPVIDSLAVIREGRLRAALGEDASLGAALLTNCLGSWELGLPNGVRLLLRQGGTRLEPLWSEDGTLRALKIRADVSASVLEAPAELDIADARFADRTTAQLEAAVSQRIQAALEQCRELGCDFLELGSRVEQASPRRARRLNASVAELLPGLELNVSVHGSLVQTLDME